MTGERRFARAAGLISSATMLSRVLGLVREQLFAALMGATMFADAFVVAFRIPNLLRDLFAEGALSSAFVPTFKAELNQHGPDAAYALANRVAGTLVVIVGALVLTGAVFAPHIVDAIAPGFAVEPAKRDLTIELTRIMLPFLALVSAAAVAMGMLNAQDRFAAPALAPAMFNTATIAVGAALYATGVTGRGVAVGWSIGTLAGGFAQLGVQLPPLWRLGFRPRPAADLALRDPGVRRVARLMAPAVVGLAAVQVNIFVNTLFATSESGAAAWLNYAFRFLQLPIGVFGVAIATVATTRFADAAADRRRDDMADQLRQGLELVAFLTVPATVGLVLLGEPIIQLIYERGAFSPHDTAAVAAALHMYAIGLVAYAAVKVVAPAFYAVDRARVPMAASITAVAVNIALNVTLHPHFGYRALAFGTAAAAIVNFGILYAAFGRAVARAPHARLLAHLVRVGAAAAAMGAAVWACHAALVDAVGTETLAARATRTLAPIAVGVAAYATACWVLRIPQLGHFARRLRRR
ncbi:MAG: murein biosynthesis integral membrane protein MurJ [Deltaproteobacteria bacterium]|nr:MAG: murein biosynthesis integral membrane protein MurJ [Deltaproteobacteria bacterium]